MLSKLLPGFFFLTLVILSLYSFSQVEHHLPYAPAWLHSLGHDHRLLSGLTASAIFSALFASYLYFLRFPPRKLSQSINLYIMIILLLAIPAYPAALSHDLFEYSFWTRILLVYGQNPYLNPASNFPRDSWTSLLHWPATTLPYGPGWIVVAVFSYLLGSGHLLTTLYSFKLVMLVFSLITCYLLAHLAKLLNQNPTKVLTFFLFNPLVIIEFFYSPHNDIITTSLLLASLALLLSRRRALSFFALLFSASIKYTTLLLAPLYLPRLRYLPPGRMLYYSHLLTLLGTLLLVFSRSINAWYFLPLFALSALLSTNPVVRYGTFSLSAGLIIRYLPYIYLGYFDPTNKIRLLLFLLCLLPFLAWYLPHLLHSREHNLVNKLYLIR